MRQTPGRMRIAALVRSNRFTMAGAILFAIIIPVLFHPYCTAHYAWARITQANEATIYGSTFALLGAHMGLRKVGILPRVDDRTLILPTFLLSYAVIVFFMTHTLGIFGRYHLWTSFAIGIAWYYLLTIARARLNFPRLAFVGQMALDEELLSERIEWVSLDKPKLPYDVLAIVFDSEQKLLPIWGGFFSRAVLRNVPLYDLGHFRESVTGRVRLRSRPELVFGHLMPSQPYLRIKRIIDTLTVVPAIVLAMPVIAVAALLIRLESPGPAIYRQQRIGYQGRRFTCYKLRSMRSGIVGLAYTEENDQRVTRIGRFIRKCRVDELPQLFNILKGEMSWIGPRPESVTLGKAYQREIPFYAYRHTVRPGITGWAAVHQGNVALTDGATLKLEYDFYYLKYFSIWLDFLIVLMTIRTVLTGFGSR